MNMNLSKLQEVLEDKEGWHAAAHGFAKVGHYHQLNGHEFEQAPGVGDG